MVIVNSTAVNVGVHGSFRMMVFHNTGPGVGIEILGLALLKFSFWPVEAVISRGCCQCPFPWNIKEGSIISRVSLVFIVCQ